MLLPLPLSLCVQYNKEKDFNAPEFDGQLRAPPTGRCSFDPRAPSLTACLLLSSAGV